MKKTTISDAELRRHQANSERMRELADLVEAEKRDFSDAEKAEIEILTRENNILSVRAAASAAPAAPAAAPDYVAQVREAVQQKRQMELRYQRETTTTADLTGTGIIPTIEGEMLNPLRGGLIYDKVGIALKHGLVGTFRWPRHTKATATWNDEVAAVTMQKINFSALNATPARLAVPVSVSRNAIAQTAGVVEDVINVEIPAAVNDAINEAMFTTVGTVEVGGDTVAKPVVGPLVAAAEADTFVKFNGAVPTRKELLRMKANVVGSGINLIAPCWVMSEAMKANLEDVKVDAGSGRFLCENDHILGYPVFTTPAIGEDIAFGDWSYQAAGFFGDETILVDPYTDADKNSVRFILNTQFATACLRPEAFCLGGARES